MQYRWENENWNVVSDLRKEMWSGAEEEGDLKIVRSCKNILAKPLPWRD